MIEASSRVPPRGHVLAVLLLSTTLSSPLARAAEGTTPLEDNRRITEGYIQLANAFQTLLDPDFQPGGTSSLRPNWFVFAPHASSAAGKGMLNAAMARHLLDAARGRPSLSVLEALDRVDLVGSVRLSVEQLSLELAAQGLPTDAAASLGALTTAMNAEALVDPRTLATTTTRLASLYWGAPGLEPLDKAEAVVRTLERTLNEGNVAIFADIGGAANAYLEWRQSAGEVTPGRVLAEFTLTGARPEETRLAYEYALAHAHDTPRPHAFDQLFPGMDGRSLVVAAFALYERARLTPESSEREALIAVANNSLAWREQHDAVQPAFSPVVPRTDEVSRPEVMRMMTPMLVVYFGTLEWTLADYAYAHEDRDGNPLTAPPTDYGWATFWDRWPPILDSFEGGYREPTTLWVMPEPIEDPLAFRPR
ncbi:hypothetical protein [Vitiosangium sp. GDMCC 1.1324]|uniref:hypothetical protein n=1 Tax=Vitiosangium sp. (strain GDMCC 1.1324) TaxID=2138576 RepID=UPI000D3BB361|nr:hypothetical protein [Vitiosangium sp. GDMCC 1.1324]PTL77093.1 hypothetical protein DAT35_46485 [Vitiosangium sp. GDMCC 1.1324]